jgi:hypothetical protein
MVAIEIWTKRPGQARMRKVKSQHTRTTQAKTSEMTEMRLSAMAAIMVERSHQKGDVAPQGEILGHGSQGQRKTPIRIT